MSDTPGVQDVFVRRIDTPPGAPWDQIRAARLEAVHGAPLGGGDLVLSVKRLAAWAPGAAGEFAAAYVHRAHVTDGPVPVRVGAFEVQFRFRNPAAAARQSRTAALTAGVLIAAGLLLGLAGARAFALRAANEDVLSRLEAGAARDRRLAAEAAAKASDAALLRRAGADPAGLAAVAGDLLWLGEAKAPSVAVQRLRWTPAALEVLSEGPGLPVLGAERPVEPVGSIAGARLWRIARSAPAAARGGFGRPSVVGATLHPSVR